MRDQPGRKEREALLAELQQVFDARTAEVLLGVMEKMVERADGIRVTREDFRELTGIVAELAGAQRRTEQRVEELALAQRRTEEQVRALAEAQQRTDERVSRLESAVERLAEAQQRTEQRVEELALAQRRTEEQVRALAEAQQRTDERVSRLESAVERLAEAQRQTTVAVAKLSKAVDRLQKQVGGLSETVGGDIEDIAYIVLHDVLKREFGWQVGVLERSWQRWNREPEEVNLFGQARDPARPGEAIWIVGEAKHNLTMQEVKRFIRQVDRARRHLVGHVFPVCFCYRARPEVQEVVREAGIRLVFSYGKLV
jgi:HD-GYP domain-containing protein (c-di-GMP phosphodiesterase class II)